MSDQSMTQILSRVEGFLDDFDQVARSAFTAYRSTPPQLLIEHSPRTAASCIYDHMVAAADRSFLGRSGIRPGDLRGLKVWILDDHTVIRFKKMDEDGKSRNYPTKQSRAYDQGVNLPGIPRPAERLTVGYLPDATGTSIERVQIAKPNGRRIDWCAAIVPLEDRASGAVIWVDVTKQRQFGIL